MRYRFSGFVLDSKTNELRQGNQPIPLTRQAYQLLVYLLANPDKIHTKDDLIEHVWQGRIVSDNTVDQSISKLRRILNEHQNGDYIETVYGQGIKFVQPVSTDSADQPERSANRLVFFAAALLLITLLWWLVPWQQDPTPHEKPQVLLINDITEANWAQLGAGQMISQILNYSGAATVRPADDRPRFVDQASYVESQQLFNPGLLTTQTTLTEQQGQYTLLVSLNGNNHNEQQSFTAADLSVVMQQAASWLANTLSVPANTQQAALLPARGHVTELYFRSLRSLQDNDFDKAQKQLELVIEEDPAFLLGRFQLAHVLQLNNQPEQSLAVLDTLMQLPLQDDLQIAATSLNAYVLDTLGQYEQSAQLYEQLFSEHQNQVSPALLRAGYEHAHTLLNRNQPAAAKQQLDWVLQHLSEHTHPGLQADVFALQGSLLQRQGDMPKANAQLQQALTMYEQNQDALGAARTYSAMARMANHQANYTLAETYLQESLAITREVGFKLGEGATLNELAYVLMVQGQHNRARELVQQLLIIGTEIDYPAMQMAARQLFFDMAREQADWPTAERHLSEHRKLAAATGHERALVKNQMLELTLRVDAGQVALAEPLVSALQQHIDTQQETRMQPRLDWLSARIKLHQQQPAAAQQQLEQALVLARQSEDGESIININNTLAALHLSLDQPDQALSRLESAAAFQPFALPHLKLKAKAHQALGEPLKALQTMNLCRQQAADLWTAADSELLDVLTREAQAVVSPTDS
jgi:DNA-binding winged helix-turn-helix (wHTH) protein